jgi:hypothetical protein
MSNVPRRSSGTPVPPHAEPVTEPSAPDEVSNTATSEAEAGEMEISTALESRGSLSPMRQSAAVSNAQSRAATPFSAHSGGNDDASHATDTPSMQMGDDDDDITETSSFHKTLNAVKPNLGTREELLLIQRVNNGELNIFDAARKNDCETIRNICKIKPEMAAAKDWGNATALHLACMLRCYEAADALLELGANANIKNPLGKLALDYIKIPAKKAYLQRRADRFNPEGDYLDDDSTVAGPATEFRAAAFDGKMRKCWKRTFLCCILKTRKVQPRSCLHA